MPCALAAAARIIGDPGHGADPGERSSSAASASGSSRNGACPLSGHLRDDEIRPPFLHPCDHLRRQAIRVRPAHHRHRQHPPARRRAATCPWLAGPRPPPPRRAASDRSSAPDRRACRRTTASPATATSPASSPVNWVPRRAWSAAAAASKLATRGAMPSHSMMMFSRSGASSGPMSFRSTPASRRFRAGGEQHRDHAAARSADDDDPVEPEMVEEARPRPAPRWRRV